MTLKQYRPFCSIKAATSTIELLKNETQRLSRPAVITACALALHAAPTAADPGDTVACGIIGLDRRGDDAAGAIAACSRLLAQAGTGSSLDERTERAYDYSNRGFAYYKKGDTEKAIADNDEAIRLRPDTDNYYNLRGIAYFEKNDFDRAIANWDKAISLFNLNPVYYKNRAKAWSAKGDGERARADYAKAIELESKKASVR